MQEKAKKLVSIVVPCYNEEKNIDRTIDGLSEVLKSVSYDYEIIAVNDGSKDNTWDVIKGYASRDPHVKGVDMMGNYGLSQAYMAGFGLAKGDYVITVAADLEISLENVLKVIAYLEQGYDFVNTNRVGRWSGNSKSRVSRSGMANKIINKIAKVDIKDTGSGMKGYRKKLVENLKLYGEMHRFIPAYLSVYKPKMVEFDVDFKDRDYGTSAYSSIGKRTIKVVLDLVTLIFMLNLTRKPYWSMPGRLFGSTGAAITGLGSVALFYLFILKLLGQDIGNRPLLMLAVLMFIVGIQSVMMGMLGELMMRVYFESSDRKPYMIRETV
jgi:glycosyltransferase involved in cell wall biosynthesis